MRVGRLAGLISIGGVAWAAWDYAHDSSLLQLLWACNVAALVLGVGLLADNSRAIWSGTVLLVAAAPLWVVWVLTHGDNGIHALVTHVVSPALGLWVIRTRPVPPRILPGIAGALIALTLFSRTLAPEGDVNFSSHPWPVLCAVLAAEISASWGVMLLLARLAPAVPLPRPPAALGVSPYRQQAFVAHLARASRRGPGEKEALKGLLARYR